MVGVSGPPLPFFAVAVRVFRPGPDDPNRASGEGRDGSDPPFLTAVAVRRGRGCQPRCQAPCQTPPPPSGGALPSSCILAGRLPGPHADRTTSRDASAGWFLLTGGGMSSWCGWHWPAVFPVEDPVAVLVHCRTPNLYRAVVYFKPGKELVNREPAQASPMKSCTSWLIQRTARLPTRRGFGKRLRPRGERAVFLSLRAVRGR